MFGDYRPLDGVAVRWILNTNYLALLEQLPCDEDLLGRLYQNRIINDIQMGFISSQKIQTDKNRRLIEIMLRKTFADVRTLIRCLEDLKYGFIGPLLLPAESNEPGMNILNENFG